MGKLKQAVLLNYGLIKSYKLSILLLMAFSLVYGLLARSWMFGLTFIAGVGAMTGSYNFGIEERNDVARMYGLLPVTRTALVAGRYVFMLLAGVLLVGVSFLAQLAGFTLLGIPAEGGEIAFALSTAMFVFLFGVSVLLPGFYKFGAIKGRLFTVVPMLLIWMPVYLLGIFLEDSSMPEAALFIGLAAVGVLSFGLSFLLSVRIYKKKEI